MLVEVADIVQELVKIEDHDFFPFGQKVLIHPSPVISVQLFLTVNLPR